MSTQSQNESADFSAEIERCQSELSALGWSAWDTRSRDGRLVNWLVAVRRDERRMVAQDPDRRTAWERVLEMAKRADKSTPAAPKP